MGNHYDPNEERDLERSLEGDRYKSVILKKRGSHVYNDVEDILKLLWKIEPNVLGGTSIDNLRYARQKFLDLFTREP